MHWNWDAFWGAAFVTALVTSLGYFIKAGYERQTDKTAPREYWVYGDFSKSTDTRIIGSELTYKEAKRLARRWTILHPRGMAAVMKNPVNKGMPRL